MGGWLIYLFVAVMLVGAAYGLLSTLSVLGRSALRSNMQGVGMEQAMQSVGPTLRSPVARAFVEAFAATFGGLMGAAFTLAQAESVSAPSRPWLPTVLFIGLAIPGVAGVCASFLASIHWQTEWRKRLVLALLVIATAVAATPLITLIGALLTGGHPGASLLALLFLLAGPVSFGNAVRVAMQSGLGSW